MTNSAELRPQPSRAEGVRVAETAIQAVLAGTRADISAVIHPQAINREAVGEPPASRGQGPAAFYATGEWLREAFSDLAWASEQSLSDGDVVVTYGVMSGRHTGNFTTWADNKVERAFVPTGKPFSVRQVHFHRLHQGLIIEHWAVRDDQGMAMQAGWIPPTPGFLLRCALASRKARRASTSLQRTADDER